MKDDNNWFQAKPRGYGWWPNTTEGWLVCGLYAVYGFSLTIWFLTRPHLSSFLVITYLLAMAAGIGTLLLFVSRRLSPELWAKNSSHFD